MDGTRVQVLRDIESWVLNPKAQQIFWLAGKAGMGKTTISRTVCIAAHANTSIVLGGSFFCSRSTGVVGQRDVRSVVPTLAQLLARQSAEFSKVLAAKLKRDPDALYQQVAEQVKQLLYTPLLALKDSPVPILFVIDALDECGDQPTPNETANDAESHRIISEMLQALVDLSQSSVKLPVKFLVTSRPETHIRDTPISDVSFSSVLHLHTVNKMQVTADIHLYISARLTSNAKLRARFTDDDAQMLAHLSDGLFIVATTALKHVLDGGTDKAVSRFKTLLNSAGNGLSSGAAAPLDRMYSLILADATRGTQGDVDEQQSTLQLLAALLVARMTLSITALADLLELDRGDVRARLSPLHAVVHVPDDDDEPGLRTLHASFGDYLMGRAPSNIRITGSLGQELLARVCLRVMTQRLYFNVSQNHSSYQPNPDTRPDTITLSLEYACLQWIRHVAATPVPSKFDEEISDIFRSRLLFWLEVVSILGQVWHAAAILFFAASTASHIFPGVIINLTYIASQVSAPKLSEFLRDANAFVTSSFEPINRSAPHIYLSALPFAPKDSLIYQTFIPLCTGLLSVEMFGIGRHGGRLIMTLTGHKYAVSSIAYSSDGSLISSSSNDGLVRIWDTRTGEETMLLKHSEYSRVCSVAFAPNGRDLAAGTRDTVRIWSISASQGRLRWIGDCFGAVYCVTFSPDGALLGTASEDTTVRLWHAETGHQIAVLNGHTGIVDVALFSPDGTYLASCSNDGTIRLWHVVTREPAGQPLESSDDLLFRACFSPDGTSLASGSIGGVIHLWDIRTRAIRSTLCGHSDSIRVISFLPDGNSLISASHDNTIRLWAIPIDTGEVSSVVLDGHAGELYSASISPNGMYIASASQDGTIKIWDAGSGKNAVQPLPAHEDCVYSVAVSPCGRFIVSGSRDHSVRVWDMQTGEPRLAPLLGHRGPVFSVTISLDGRLIASASMDHTIRLWDAETGNAIGPPIIGHEDRVNTVRFSPDSQRLASGSGDLTVLLWDVATGQRCDVAPLRCDGYVTAVAFSPEGTLLAASDGGGFIHFWQPETGEPICEPLRKTAQGIYFIGFSSDGERIIAYDYAHGIRVWNSSAEKELLSFGDQQKLVLSVAFSPNGQLICSGLSESTVQLWNASTGVLISTLHKHAGFVRSVVFTPSGQSVVSCSDDKTIRVWDVSSAYSLSSGSTIAAFVPSNYKNGWVLGSADELLVWVPVDYRKHLQLPFCTLLIGRCRVHVKIGSSGWHRGESWTSCWRKV